MRQRLPFLLVLLAMMTKSRGGQLRSVCILIPAYNPEEMAEGENEEEEVRGWGPGPSSSSSSSSSGGGPATIVTDSNGEETEEGGYAGPPPVPSGSPTTPGEGGSVQGSLTDPSKPPGPNPRWGYWEWDAESRRWEIEDYRRRRRQVAGGVLEGKIHCGPGTVIHVDKVTLGFSIDNQCSPVRAPCQMTSTLGRQVAHCEGQTGACAVTVQQAYMALCGRRTNYAKILYECISETERRNICETKTFQSDGGLLIASPSFAGSSGVGAHGQYLSCECEVTRGANAQLEVAWARSRFEAGPGDSCGDEMLLLDTWDDAGNRFKLQEEVCGLKSLRDRSFGNSIVKITYIPSPASESSNGFLLKIQGKPNSSARLQTTCSVLAVDGTPSPGAQPPVPSGQSRPDHVLASLNKTIDTRRSSINAEGNSAGMTGTDHSARAEGAGLPGTRQNSPDVGNSGGLGQKEDSFDVKGTSGTLSAVVASLGSVILVMGSLGIFVWYRRRQRRKQKGSNDEYCDSRATTYDDPTYLDPVGPKSTIPTLPPPSLSTPLASAASTPSSSSKHAAGRCIYSNDPQHDGGGVPKLQLRQLSAKDALRSVQGLLRSAAKPEPGSFSGSSSGSAIEDGDLQQTEGRRRMKKAREGGRTATTPGFPPALPERPPRAKRTAPRAARQGPSHSRPSGDVDLYDNADVTPHEPITEEKDGSASAVSTQDDVNSCEAVLSVSENVVGAVDPEAIYASLDDDTSIFDSFSEDDEPSLTSHDELSGQQQQ